MALPETTGGGARPEVLASARRLGPRPWSALGEGPPADLPAGLGAWLVATVGTAWDRLGRPDPLTVVEVGAGDGRRAAAVVGADAPWSPALRYVLVEPDRPARARQSGHVALEDPALVAGPVGPPDADGLAVGGGGSGPLAASLAGTPTIREDVVVVAPGWLSRLPADRYRWRDGAWWERRLAASGDTLVDLEVPADPTVAAALERCLPPGGARPGTVAVPVGAHRWLAATLAGVRRGEVVVVDTLTSVAAMAAAPAGGPVGVAGDGLRSLCRPDAEGTVADPLRWMAWRLG